MADMIVIDGIRYKRDHPKAKEHLAAKKRTGESDVHDKATRGAANKKVASKDADRN